jgi:hypothetical protein
MAKKTIDAIGNVVFVGNKFAISRDYFGITSDINRASPPAALYNHRAKAERSKSVYSLEGV